MSDENTAVLDPPLAPAQPAATPDPLLAAASDYYESMVEPARKGEGGSDVSPAADAGVKIADAATAFSPELLAQAKEQYGLGDEEVKLFDSPEELQKQMFLMDRRLVADGQRRLEAAKVEEPAKAPAASLAAPKTEVAQAIAALDPAEFTDDPAVQKLVALANALSAKLTEIEGTKFKTIDEIAATHKAQQAAIVNRDQIEHQYEFDAILNDLNAELFGKVDRNSRQPLDKQLTPEQYKARTELWDTERSIVASLIANGQLAGLTRQQGLERSYRAAFPSAAFLKENRQAFEVTRRQSRKRIGSASGARPIQNVAGTSSPHTDENVNAAFEAATE